MEVSSGRQEGGGREKGRILRGRSVQSFLFPIGRMTRVTPARFEAMHFSRTPPMGNTLPVRVISPVIARLLSTGLLSAREMRDVTIVMPAEGPSFGVAPSGMCMCSDAPSKKRFPCKTCSR